MYVIQRFSITGRIDYFGPFPTREQAEEYGNAFENDTRFIIRELIIPNCVTIKLNY